MRSRTLVIAVLLAGAAPSLAGCSASTSGDPVAAPGAPAPQVSTPAAADPMDAAPAIPTPSPGATVDPAAQAKADGWVAAARVPPAAVKVTYPPSGTTIDDQGQDWWCAPMAEADAYWRVPHMDLSRTANWLRAHPSNGLTVTAPAPETLDPTITNAAVYDFPSPTAFQGMTFDIASWGRDGSVIHLQVGVLAKDSVCATPAPGTELGTAGG